MRQRIREIIMQTCTEMGGHIVQGVLGRDHVHMFLSIPPKLSLSNVMQRIKGRSSRWIQMEFPELRKRYWGRRFWARGYFSTTSGNVTDDIITQYLELHSSKWLTRLARRKKFVDRNVGGHASPRFSGETVRA
jgi:putative transposase